MATAFTNAKEIADSLKRSVEYQDCPKNRTIRKITVGAETPDRVEGLTRWLIIVTSDCDGWAEDDGKIIARTYVRPTERMLQRCVGKSEEYAIKSFEETMENTLCLVLEKLFATPDIFKECEGEYYHFADNNHPLVDLAEEYACGYLITDGGACNWENIMKLRSGGYEVFAGDKDSFGWLTGCIAKDKLCLVYG